MTREHKLALIVGFALLLLVGVLISDHLSRAREVRIDNVALEPAVAVQPPSKAVPIDPLQPVNRSFTPAEQPNTSTQSPQLPSVTEPLAAPVETAPLRLADASKPATTVPDLGPSLGGDGSLESAILKTGGTIAPEGGGVREFTLGDASKPVTPPPGSAKPAASTPSKPVNATPDRTHVVKKNETLFALAKSYYGDGKYWTAIAEHNKDKVGKNGALREGQSLRIPPRMAVTGKPDPAPAKTVTPSKLAEGTRVASARTYTVKKNDTLGDVSKAMYGTSKRWRDILAANQSLIDDEDHLMVGTVLKVPG